MLQLSFLENEFVSILGQSDSGKTTLLNIIGCCAGIIGIGVSLIALLPINNRWITSCKESCKEGSGHRSKN